LYPAIRNSFLLSLAYTGEEKLVGNFPKVLYLRRQPDRGTDMYRERERERELVKTRCRVRLVTDAIQGWRERYVI
jgi:hypothetical protein